MICKSCNTINEEGASFCKECGARLSPENVQDFGGFQTPPNSFDSTQVPPADNFGGTQTPPPNSFDSNQVPPADNFGGAQTPPPNNFDSNQVPPTDNFGGAQTPPPNSFGGAQTPPPNNFGGGQFPPNYGQPVYGEPQPYGPGNDSGNPPKAIASLVLGISSLVGGCIPYLNFIAWILAIVGIILGVMSKKEKPTGMATAGIVCSIIALALDVIMIILVFAIGMSIGLLRM